MNVRWQVISLLRGVKRTYVECNPSNNVRISSLSRVVTQSTPATKMGNSSELSKGVD